MTSIALRKLTITALLLGGFTVLPSIVHAQDATGEESPPTDVSVDDGSAGDGTGDGVVDAGTGVDDGTVDDGTVDGGDGEVTTTDVETEYDPVIAQSGVPQGQGTGEGQHGDASVLSGNHGSGGQFLLPKHGARRSLFGSNSPLREWLDN